MNNEPQKAPRPFQYVPERPPGLATTNLTNQLARAINAMDPVIETGQVEEPWGGGGASDDTSAAQYQGMQRMMVTNNTVGWDFDALLPIP